MTRVHGRTVLASFHDASKAREAARLIRQKGLGETQVADLTDRPGEASSAFGPEDSLFGPDAALLSANNLGPLSTTAYALGEDVTERPGELIGRRPRLGDILLTVVTGEETVPAIVSIIKEHGGSV